MLVAQSSAGIEVYICISYTVFDVTPIPPGTSSYYTNWPCQGSWCFNKALNKTKSVTDRLNSF